MACTIAYLASARTRARLENVVVLLVSAVGVATGVKLMVICVTTDDLAPFSDEDRLYIFVGGVALVWVSAQAVYRVFRPAPR